MTQPDNTDDIEAEADFSNKLKKLSIEKLEEIIAKSIENELGVSYSCTILKMKLGDGCISDSFLNLKLKEDFKSKD